ncbi:MAG: STAS domain-containing protein [Spirochaetes bacterium]|nr:STAS domain-containing protein [Spirochaetota bacterium]
MIKTVQTTEKNGKITLINIEGPLTSDGSSHFEGLISSLLAENSYFIAVNFSQVDFVSSAGIGVVLFTSQLVRKRGGNIVFFSASKEIISLFSILNLTKTVILLPDKKEAVRFLSREISESAQNKTESTDKAKNILPDNTALKTEKAVTEDGNIIFNNPLIIECAECGSFVRVHQSGDYICPSCHTEFLAKKDGTVVF